MPILPVRLIFIDKPSKINYQLIQFIKGSIQPIIIKGQISFQFQIIGINDLETLKKEGINNFPALVPQNSEPIYGLSNIVGYLKNKIVTSKTQAVPKSEEEVLQEFFNKEISTGVSKVGNNLVTNDTDDQEENEGEKLRTAALQESSRRGVNTKNAPGGRGQPNRPGSKPGQPNKGSAARAVQNNQAKQETLRTSVQRSMRGGFSNDDEETEEFNYSKDTKPKAAAPRNDNIQTPDPMESYNQMPSSQKGNSDDDKMMKALLQRLDVDT